MDKQEREEFPVSLVWLLHLRVESIEQLAEQLGRDYWVDADAVRLSAS